MARILSAILMCAAAASFVHGQVEVGAAVKKANEKEDDAQEKEKTPAQEQFEMKQELLKWLENEELKTKDYAKDETKAREFLTEVKFKSLMYKSDKQIAAACVKAVSSLIWSKEIAIQTEAVKVLALYPGNDRALQYLSRLCGALARKDIDSENLQIAIVNAIADVAPFTDGAASVLLNVLKNDYEATDAVRVQTIGAMSRMPSMGTVNALLEAILVLSPDPARCGTSGDFMKNSRWRKYEGPLYSAIQGLIGIDDARIPYSDLKKFVQKNTKRINDGFTKQKKEFEARTNPPAEDQSF